MHTAGYLTLANETLPEPILPLRPIFLIEREKLILNVPAQAYSQKALRA